MSSAGAAGNAVREAALRLRSEGETLRARPQSEVIDVLATVLDAWSEGGGRWQRELAAKLAESSGFSEATVRSGMGAALSGWNGEALRQVVVRELRVNERGVSERGANKRGSEDARGHALTSVLLAGCIPMPTLLQTLLVLAVRSPALLKMASRDRVTAGVVRDSLEAVDPQLARCVEVLEPEALENASAKAAFFASPCVVASGSDETVAAVRAQLTSGQSLLSYGHRLSIAVIGRDALDAETAHALAEDVAAWDQLGCLSPAVAFVVGGGPTETADFARHLSEHLEQLEREAPRGSIDPASAAQIRVERESARMRFASLQGDPTVPKPQLLASRGTEWTVVLEVDEGAAAALRPAPLHRFLRIHPVQDGAALRTLSAPIARWISTIATAGLAGQDAAALSQLGGHRICRPGQMQAPELGWHRDGQSLLRPLIP